MEFSMTTDVRSLVEGTVLAFNFEELKTELSAQLEKYRNVVVTPETLTDAKQQRAKLNKVYKAIDEERKTIKQEYCKPLVEFEQKAKTLTGMIAECSDLIDVQVKELEERVKQEKMSRIEAYYASVAGEDVLQYYSFAYVSNPTFCGSKWTNATASEEQIRSDIDRFVSAFKNNVDALNEACEGQTDAVADVLKRQFKSSLDIASVYRKLKEIQEIERQRIEAQRHAEEMRKAEEQKKMEREMKSEPTITANDFAPAEASEPVFTFTLEISGTRQQMVDLKNFMNRNGIKFFKKG